MIDRYDYDLLVEPVRNSDRFNGKVNNKKDETTGLEVHRSG